MKETASWKSVLTRKLVLSLAAVLALGCSQEEGFSRGQSDAASERISSGANEDSGPAATRESSERSEDSDDDVPEELEVDVMGESGRTIGSLRVTPTADGGTRFRVDVAGLTRGAHAVHIHSRARCEAPGFWTAGGHYDPAGSRHGKPDGDRDFDDPDHHAGDMRNQTVGDDGRLDVEIVNESVSLLEGANRLLDEDGSAFVIYAGADDYETQPSGNAGRRVACAALHVR